MTENYRKIWTEAYGPIPKDKDGRTYEIHHIDGNHKNNNLENLQCLSIQEHYDIHFAQGDWNECLIMFDRINISPQEKSEISRLSNLKRIKEGTHNFLIENFHKNICKKKILNGTHHFLGPNVNNKRIKEGKHHFIGNTNPVYKQLENGTHNFSGGSLQRRRIKEGTHPFYIEHICPHCNKKGKSPAMFQWHFDNCKKKAKK